jgi:uncharacterized membrane protein
MNDFFRLYAQTIGTGAAVIAAVTIFVLWIATNRDGRRGSSDRW